MVEPLVAPSERAVHHPRWWAAVVALVVVGTCYLLGAPTYQTNDDVLYAMIAGGYGLALRPDIHVLFPHVWIGRVVVGLQRLVSVDAYALHHLVAVSASVSVGTAALLRLARDRREAFLAGAAALLVAPVPLLQPQFTVSAGLLAAAAAMQALAAALAPRPTRRGRALDWLVVAALAVYGILTRHEAAALIALAFLGPFAWLAWRAGRRGFVVAGIAGMAAAAVFLGLRVVDDQAYAGPEWRPYLESRAALSDIVDFGRAPYGPATRSAYDAVGWSANDAALIRRWYFVEPVSYTPARGARVLGDASAWRGWAQSVASLRAVVTLLRSDRRLVLLLAAVGVLTFALALVSDGERTLVYAASVACAVSAVTLPTLLGRPPVFRVWLPVLAALVWLGVGLFFTRRPAVLRGWRAHALPLLSWGLVLLAVLLLVVAVRQARGAAARAEVAQSDLLRLAPRADELYVAWGAAFPFEALVRPWRTDPTMKGMRLLMLSSPTFTPFSTQMRSAFQIDDLPQALLTRGDVHLVAASKDLPLLAQAYREHYGVETRMCERFRGDTLVVYDVRRLDSAEPDAACLVFPGPGSEPHSDGPSTR